MKNIFKMVSIFMLMLSGFAFGQTLENSAALVIKEDLPVGKQFAKQIHLKNFDSKLKIEKLLGINGNEFTDDGQNNDLTAGDGIYTSVAVYDKTTNDSAIGGVLISDEFQYSNELFGTSKFSIKCKIRRIHSGHTIIFHTDCSTHWCVELYDCEVEIGW